MASGPDDTDIKSLVKAIRKRPHNCAVYLGKDAPVFIADPRRPPEALRKQAKAAGAGPKGTTGTVLFDGPTMVIDCLEDPPGRLRKALRKHFSDQGLQIKVLLRRPDGSEIADAEEETEASPEADGAEAGGSAGEAAAPESASAGADVRRDLVRSFGELKPEVARLLKVAGPQQQATLKKLVDAFGKDMKAGSEERAQLILRKIRELAADIDQRRTDGKRQRRGELDAVRSRVETIRERMRRLTATGGTA